MTAVEPLPSVSSTNKEESIKPRFVGERVKLGDVCTIVSGATPKTKTDEYWGGEIKWITPAELNSDSHYVSDTERHLTVAGYKSASLHMMPKGTVLLTTRAPIGKVAIATEEMCCNQGFKNLVCSSAINNEYLFLYLKSRTAELQSMGRGATFKELSKKNVAGFEINLPDIDRQLDAVAKLTVIEVQIARAKQQLDQLESLVKSQFIEMFGDPNDQRPSTFIEDGFSIRDDLRKPLSGTERSGMHDGELYPYYGANGVVDYINSYLTDFDALCFAEDCGSYGAGESSTYVIEGRGWVNNHAHLLKPKEDCLLRYADTYFYLLDLNRLISGTTRAKLTQAQLKQIRFAIPPLDLRRRFTTFYCQVDKLRFKTQQQIKKLEMLKNSLMQEYFGQ